MLVRSKRATFHQHAARAVHRALRHADSAGKLAEADLGIGEERVEDVERVCHGSQRWLGRCRRLERHRATP